MASMKHILPQDSFREIKDKDNMIIPLALENINNEIESVQKENPAEISTNPADKTIFRSKSSPLISKPKLPDIPENYEVQKDESVIEHEMRSLKTSMFNNSKLS
jgi:hypothetical protein